MDHHLHLELPLLPFKIGKTAIIASLCLMSVAVLLQFDLATAAEMKTAPKMACGSPVTIGQH